MLSLKYIFLGSPRAADVNLYYKNTFLRFRYDTTKLNSIIAASLFDFVPPGKLSEGRQLPLTLCVLNSSAET